MTTATDIKIMIDLGEYIREYDDPDRGAVYNTPTMRYNSLSGMDTLIAGGWTNENKNFFDLTEKQLADIRKVIAQVHALGLHICGSRVIVRRVTDVDRKFFVDYCVFISVDTPENGVFSFTTEIPR